MRLELNKMHYPVTSLGPGRRVGLWTQGCGLACDGCISRDTWAADPARAVDVEQLATWIASIPAGAVDGVTISGGEPFDQPEALAALLAALREWSAASGRQLDLLCYSGYGLRRLQRLHGQVLEQLDGVISGPFVAARPTRLVWRGSANQELVPLTQLGRERYGPYID